MTNGVMEIGMEDESEQSVVRVRRGLFASVHRRRVSSMAACVRGRVEWRTEAEGEVRVASLSDLCWIGARLCSRPSHRASSEWEADPGGVPHSPQSTQLTLPSEASEARDERPARHNRALLQRQRPVSSNDASAHQRTWKAFI